MPPQLSEPRTDPPGLEELRSLWIELHRHHRQVADYRDLVEDVEASWERRLRWYRRLLQEGAAYITAVDAGGRPVGYAMVTVTGEPDDTFDSRGGTAELATLVVSSEHRSGGLGAALLAAAEAFARSRGADVLGIAVMAGNVRAYAFYEAHGYTVAEHILYRRLDD